MAHSMPELMQDSLIWLAHHPWPARAILVVFQLFVIAAAAGMLVFGMCGRNATSAYRIWSSAAVLMLGIVPAHLILRGWAVPIKQASEANEIAAVDSLRQSAVTNTSSPAQAAAASDSVSAQAPAAENDRFNNADGAGTNTDKPLKTTAEFAKSLLRGGVNSAQSKGSNWDWERLALVAASIYVVGVFVLIVKLCLGTWKLRSIVRRSACLNSSAYSMVPIIAEQLGLRRSPDVKASELLDMPLLFGLRRPTVLVPHDFDSWPEDERRTVLLHEFAHVKRQDLLGELLSRVTQALYWFHPAIWYLGRQLKQTRELAADQWVVQSGVDPKNYAESLVAILARINSIPGSHSTNPLPVVAMSMIGNLEARMDHIFGCKPIYQNVRWARIAVMILILVTVASTIRLEISNVQAAPPPNSTAAKSTDESDLYQRFRDCEVLTVTGGEFHSEFTISGQVLSPEGMPVPNAVVLMRESSTNRISSEPQRYIERPDRHLVRANDVFARTTTDRDGKFHFTDVKSPAMPKRWTNLWSGNVVAAHETIGIGWIPLDDKNTKQRVDSGLVISLRPTTSVSGALISPEKHSIADASVSLFLLEPASQTSIEVTQRNQLDLQLSQLTPRTKTDREGKFHLTNVPKGLAAIVTAHHVDWQDAHAAIATSQDLALGARGTSLSYSVDQLVANPATLIADLGVSVAGRVVDEEGKPVKGAKISKSSAVDQFETDDEGNFQFRFPKEWVARERQRNNGKMRFYVRAPEKSDLLNRYIDQTLENQLAGEQLAIELKRGVRVTGRVTLSDGTPIPEITVRPLIELSEGVFGAKTDSNGEFELLLPKRSHTILIGTDEPGYQLPSSRDITFATDQSASSWPHKTVDVSDGVTKHLEPFLVSKISGLQVMVSLPDGRPASGATVILKDDMQGARSSNQPFPEVRKKEISNRAQTNNQGRADILPQGVATANAFVEVTYVDEKQAFDGIAKVQEAKDGLLHIVLKKTAILQGRVLLDGRPVVGADVSIGQTERDAKRPGAMSVSNHRSALTDADGWYRAAVPADKEYSVSVRSIPGQSDTFGFGYSPRFGADGVLQVRDFQFKRGTEEIAGIVIDDAGKPVARASVYVHRTADSAPNLWLGHRSESLSETDARGRFHLKKIPPGSYQLHVVGRRGTGERTSSTLVDAKTGDMNLEITIENRQPPELPRLQPKKITDIEDDPRNR